MQRKFIFLTLTLVGLLVLFIIPVQAEEKPPVSSSNSITINNGVIEVTIGEQHSWDWWYGGTDHLYLERFAVSYNDILCTEAIFSDENFTVKEPFPTTTGDPDTWYKCVLEYDVIEIERCVKVPSGEKWFSINYVIKNTGTEPISLIFCQGVDYDLSKTWWEDCGAYVHEFDAVVGWDAEIGWPWVGFKCDNWHSIGHGVYDYYLEMWDDLRSCHINDVDYCCEAYDLGVALAFGFGLPDCPICGPAIEPDQSVTLAFNFAFADEPDEIDYLLEEVPCPVIPEFPMGTVTSVATPILALVTLALVRRRRTLKKVS